MKKVSYLLFIVVVVMFLMINPVLATDIHCNFLGKNVNIDEKLPDTIHLIILVLQIAVPILLVVLGSIDFVKAISSQKDDEIKKGQKTFISRIVAGVIIFFVVAVVKLVISLVGGDNASDLINCADCFLSGKNSTGCKAAQK